MKLCKVLSILLLVSCSKQMLSNGPQLAQRRHSPEESIDARQEAWSNHPVEMAAKTGVSKCEEERTLVNQEPSERQVVQRVRPGSRASTNTVKSSKRMTTGKANTRPVKSSRSVQ